MKDRMEELYRPNAITRDLITNEDEINKIKESEKTNWDYVFADSADDEEPDEKLRYRMRDIDTPPTYSTEVDYYDPTTIQIETEITGQKKWKEDTLKERPRLITVYLLANGEEVKKQTVTDRTNWTYRFTNIPVYDAAGEKIMYTVREKAIPGYITAYEGFDIINTKKPAAVGKTVNHEEATNLEASRATRIGLFVVGAAALTAGLLWDQLRNEE